jgi:hypothetical protein
MAFRRVGFSRAPRWLVIGALAYHVPRAAKKMKSSMMRVEVGESKSPEPRSVESCGVSLTSVVRVSGTAGKGKREKEKTNLHDERVVRVGSAS